MYTVDENVFHGVSGRPVLNDNNKVIGITRVSIEGMDEKDLRTGMERDFTYRCIV